MRHIIKNGSWVSLTDYLPGDELVFREVDGPFPGVYASLKGEPGKPITITCEGVPVIKAGIEFVDCQHVKASGFAIDGGEGWEQNNGVAINIKGKSSDIELFNFKVVRHGFGMWIKNEGDPSLSDWVLNNISIHDFTMMNLNQHGFYAGATEQINISRPVIIDGKQVFPQPSRLGNIKIYNGGIYNVGKNGIMLSDARFGMSEIYNNYIENTGAQKQMDQGTGISIGGYSNAIVRNNTVKNTWLWGIAAFGPQDITIKDNTVSEAGETLVWPKEIMLKAQEGVQTKAMICGNVFPDGKPIVPDTSLPFENCTKNLLWTAYKVVSGKRKYYNVYSDNTWNWK